MTSSVVDRHFFLNSVVCMYTSQLLLVILFFDVVKNINGQSKKVSAAVSFFFITIGIFLLFKFWFWLKTVMKTQTNFLIKKIKQFFWHLQTTKRISIKNSSEKNHFKWYRNPRESIKVKWYRLKNGCLLMELYYK